MSQAISTMQLSSLTNLFQEKKKLLKELAANLKVADVKEDDRFDATVKRIKKQVLLTPVSIEEPKISGHQETTRQMPPNVHNMWGGPQQIFVVTVSFPFTGSRELFAYRADGLSLTLGRVHQPSGSSILVEVTINRLDKEQALREARGSMETTLSLIDGNNPQAESWSEEIEPDIDDFLKQRRQELLDFYS